MNNHPNVRMHGETLNISNKNNKDGIFYYLKERSQIINKLFLPLQAF
jgi:hypothetical protein